MLHVNAAGTSRQAVILAGILAIHFGLFLVVADIRIDVPAERSPGPPQVVNILPHQPPPLEKPKAPEQWEFGQTVVERPDEVIFPAADPEPAESQAGADAAAGTGPVAAHAPDVGTRPAIAMHLSKLSAVINACYPSASRRMAEEGAVRVRVMIGASGNVTAWRVLQSSGFPRLDAAVPCVLGRLPFSAATRNGAPVPSEVDLPITFQLN